MISLFDTHTHLDYDYPFSTEELLRRAKEVGVAHFLSVGAAFSNWDQVQALSVNHTNDTSNVYHSLGIHPHDAKDFNQNIFDEIKSRSTATGFVAVGEIGLDYFYDNSTPEQQISAFREQLNLARALNKPVIIHARDGKDRPAEGDILKELKHHVSLSAPQLREKIGVIHCFSGTLSFEQECLDLGFYISFSGIVTFKKADTVKLAAQSCPKDRLLIETDAPYLAPMPHRGKQNESAYLIETAKYLAELRHWDLTQLAEITTANACRLFLQDKQ